jgi:chromosome segregation ATPase
LPGEFELKRDVAGGRRSVAPGDGRGASAAVIWPSQCNAVNVQRVEPTDLTIKILQEIRDEQRATRGELSATRTQLSDRIGHLADESRQTREVFTQRFEVIETALRDMAEQLVMLGRGVKVALESRSAGDRRVDDLERRIADLEKERQPH